MTSARARRLELGLLIGIGLLSAALGLRSLPLVPQPQRWQAYFLVGVGVIALALAAHGLVRGTLPLGVDPRLTRLSSWLGVSPSRAVLLLSAPVLSWAAWLTAGDLDRMHLPALAVSLWLMSWVALWAGGWFPSTPGRADRAWPRGEVAAVTLLTLAGLAARVIQLDAIPWLFTGDEGAASLEALKFVTGVRNNLFNTAWFSFPSLFSFLQSIPMAVLGRSIASARLASAAAGSLTVAAVWWCARPIFGRTAALAATAVMATFPLQIHFSRTALNNVWDGLTAAIFVGAAFRAWETNRRSAFLLAGFTLGLSQYFYTSARSWLLILPAWILIAWARDRAATRTRLPGVFLMGLAALVVLLPLAGFYLLHPAEFMAPVNRVSMFGEWGSLLIRLSGRTPLQTVWHQVSGSVMGFGPWPMFGHFSPAPMLLPFTAALFWLGIGILIVKHEPVSHRWLLLWPVATILIAAVSDNPPTSQRYVFVSPFIAMMIALPGCQTAAWLLARRPRWRTPIGVGLGLLVMLVMALNLRFYFGEYTPGRQFGDPNTEVATQVARFLQEQGGPREVYFFGPPRMGYYSHGTIEYLVPEATGYDVSEPLASLPTWVLTRPTTFIFLPERLGERVLVQSAYPGGTAYTGRSPTGVPLYYAYSFPLP